MADKDLENLNISGKDEIRAEERPSEPEGVRHVETGSQNEETPAMSPLKKRLWKMILLGIREFGDPYYQGFAAQVAFYQLLSLVPTVMLVTQLLYLLHIPTSSIDAWMSKYMTGGMATVIRGFLTNRLSAGSNITLLLVGIWAASRAEFATMRICNYIYSGGHSTGRFIPERARSLRLMLITVFTYAFVAGVLIYGKVFLELLLRNVMDTSDVNFYWSLLRWPIILLLYYFMVFYNYYIMPMRKIDGKSTAPGALFTAIGMMLVTAFYAIYVDYIADYNIIYGSLASIAAIMFWLYFMSWVLILGMLVNKLLMDTSDMCGKE